MGKVSEPHLLHAFLVFFFLLTSPIAAQECCEEKTKEEKEACVNCLAIAQFKRDVGDFRWMTKLDLTFGKSPRPNFIEFTGKGENQMILGERLLLSRSTKSNGKDNESITVTGFRTDSNEFFHLTFDSNRTPFGWFEGVTEWDGSRVLKDPSDYVLIRTVWEKNGTDTTTYSLGDALFMETTKKPGRKSKVNPLGTLLDSPITPRKINREDDNRDSAENFSEEHLLLQKLAGNFALDSEDGSEEEIIARVICEGRFLIRASMETDEEGEESESLAFIGFDSSKQVFQMFQFNSEVSYPKYWTGAYEEETLTFKNPYSGGKLIEVHFREDGGYTSTHTSEDDGELGREKRFGVAKKKRR